MVGLVKFDTRQLVMQFSAFQVVRFGQICYSIVGYTLVVVSLCVFGFGAIKVQELRS